MLKNWKYIKSALHNLERKLQTVRFFIKEKLQYIKYFQFLCYLYLDFTDDQRLNQAHSILN